MQAPNLFSEAFNDQLSARSSRLTDITVQLLPCPYLGDWSNDSEPNASSSHSSETHLLGVSLPQVIASLTDPVIGDAEQTHTPLATPHVVHAQLDTGDQCTDTFVDAFVQEDLARVILGQPLQSGGAVKVPSRLLRTWVTPMICLLSSRTGAQRMVLVR